MDITASSTTATSTVITATGAPVGTLALDVQYSMRPDFMWCIAPLIRSSGPGALALQGINQAATYYIRARPVLSTGQTGAWTPTIAVVTPVLALRDLSPAPVLIEPALIAIPQSVLAWAADNEQAGYPVRALGRDDPNSTWWSARSGLTFAFEAHMAAAPVDTIAVLETNASESTTITIKAGPDAANVRSTSPSFTHVSQPFRASPGLPQRRGYHALVRLVEAQSYPYWRVEIGGAIPGDLFVASYAVFGLGRQTKNFSTDKSETVADYGKIERDRSGNASRVLGYRGRLVDFEISNITEAQYEGVYEQVRWLVGTTEPALIVPNTKAGAFLHDRILYGTMRAGRASQPYSVLFSHQFSVDSLI